MMKQVADYTAEHGHQGRAHITIYEDDGGQRYVVVIAEPDDPDYDGPSVTNNIETIAASVVMAHVLPSSATLFFEHYPASMRPGRPPMGRETFDKVSFSNTEADITISADRWTMALGEPDWHPSSRAELQRYTGCNYVGEEGATDNRRPDRGRSTPPQTPPGIERAAEHNMDLSLRWDSPQGDIIVRRVANFEAGFDLGDHLQTTLQTNVAWTVIHHSPSGFEYGYYGSGPADLALNILNMFVAPGADGHQPVECFAGTASRTAWDLHQDFKEQFIATVPREGGIITGSEIRSWIEAITAKEG